MMAVPQATISPMSWPTTAASERADDRVRAELSGACLHPRDRFLARRGEHVAELGQRVAVAEGVEPGHDVAAEAATPHGEPKPERRTAR